MGEVQDTLFPLEGNRSVKVRAEAAGAMTVNTEYWHEIGTQLKKLHPARGSPPLLALPSSA